MTVAILRNGREGTVFAFIAGFCSDGNLGETGFPGDPQFDQVTFPATSAGAGQPCVKLQSMVASASCFTSINGLSTGDCLLVPLAGGGTTCVPMGQVGGVAQLFQSTTPGITAAVGVAIDATLCNGHGYWTRGPNNAQIAMPGHVLMYHELVGHAFHHCDGTFNAADPEGQAIGEENVLRGALGLPTRTAHEGGCNPGGNNGCFIASAAYGSEVAAEVQELRAIRDQFLRSTRWGEAFFEEAYRYYYAISPPLAQRMREDDRLRTIVRVLLVEPWTIALRLLLALPADPTDPPQAIGFTSEAADAFAAWVERLPVDEARPDDAATAADDVAIILGLVPNAAVRDALAARLGATARSLRDLAAGGAATSPGDRP